MKSLKNPSEREEGVSSQVFFKDFLLFFSNLLLFFKFSDIRLRQRLSVAAAVAIGNKKTFGGPFGSFVTGIGIDVGN